jgi:hypothetical protein
VQSKLHIDLSQGLVEVEGDVDLVREIYRDLKDHLLSGAPPPGRTQPRTREEAPPPDNNGEGNPKSKRRSSPRKKADSDSGSSGISADAPRLDKNLDTSKLGAFYGQFEPKTNAEKILIFLKFITEELGQESPNTDQVYTCFKKTGEKIPKAYAQAFYDTSSKHGFIDFRSATDIAVTIAGDNHFTHGLKRKGAE